MGSVEGRTLEVVRAKETEQKHAEGFSCTIFS